ncbi:MAG: DUF3445 domain-containing protein [Alphaproteobacteria bacterium]|nr:DUF3445 domain-containing protein [Alphaproteobacteria bacterium]
MEQKTRRLPGINSLAPGDWLWVDEVYGAQMAYREQLLAERLDEVYRQNAQALPAAQELLAMILNEVGALDGFEVSRDHVICQDGRRIGINQAEPLITAARLVQEDLILMEGQGDEHLLTAGVLCFPASWSLAEKFGKNLVGIHTPVAEYTDDLARRVQRLFDHIKPERPMWRANFLTYANPDLFQPRVENNRRQAESAGDLWVRVERQCLLKLPITGAVVFSIHSHVVPISVLSEPERDELFTQQKGPPEE